MFSREGALPRRGYLGFSVEARPAPADLHEEGAERWIVSELDEGSPAERSTLQVGDDLVTVGGQRIQSLAELRARAAAVRPGEICELTVLRKGDPIQVRVRAEEMPVERLSSGDVVLREIDWLHEGRIVKLRAIWTEPKERPLATVWILPSASWISLECPFDPLDPIFQLVDFFTAHRIATLRVDRSGLGDSQGPPLERVGFDDEHAMLLAARTHFFEHARGVRCLFGRSLGGMWAPLLAADQAIDRIVCWGTSSRRWHEAMLESMEHQLRLRGLSGDKLEQELSKIEHLQRLIYLDGYTPDEARALAPELEGVGPDYKGTLAFDRVVEFFRGFQTTDVAEAWRRVDAHVLAVHAEYDIIVNEHALREIARLPRGPSHFRLMEGVDHFIHERSSLEAAVARPWGTTFSRRAADMIVRFYLDRTAT